AKVFAAGVAEWRRSTVGKKVDREGTRARLATAMAAAVAAEMDRLADRLNILATIGSVAPFVGLFGTVWGIMKSFTDIAAQQNTSLGVVAPGIAEALFATALGLFAAIPAVIAYNRLSHRLNSYEARLHRFADGFHATLSRELEHDADAA
ncbi:MAG: Tol-Pal system, TolQ, partial [Sphingomonas bacterium]|nr:Tol-Pal system, TolQ [Sphingomonas bacterium]